jgi:RNA-binding protein YlmH
VQSKLYPCGLRFFPSEKSSAHTMVGFGDLATLGYEEDFPVDVILVTPKSLKFAENLQHKDYLGSLMNLGIERNAVGDLYVKDKVCALYIKRTLTPLILSEFTRVRHTPVEARLIDKIPDKFMPEMIEKSATVQSIRLDSIISRIFNISREEAKKRIQQETVAINGRFLPDPSISPHPGDTLTLRGGGKAEFLGSSGETKKGRLKITWKQYT